MGEGLAVKRTVNFSRWPGSMTASFSGWVTCGGTPSFTATLAAVVASPVAFTALQEYRPECALLAEEDFLLEILSLTLDNRKENSLTFLYTQCASSIDSGQDVIRAVLNALIVLGPEHLGARHPGHLAF